MFRNRSLNVSLVKNKKSKEVPETESSLPPVDYAHIVRQNAKDAAIVVGGLLVTYILLDTLRQATIRIIENK